MNKPVIFVTGQMDDSREETGRWLRKHGFSSDRLYMRVTGDYREDSIVKQEIYEKYIKDY